MQITCLPVCTQTERNLSARISLRPWGGEDCTLQDINAQILPGSLSPPLSSLPLNFLPKKLHQYRKYCHGHSRRRNSSVAHRGAANNWSDWHGGDGNHVCPTPGGRWMEEVRIFMTELSPLLMTSTGFTSVICRASMTSSKSNIKVPSCLATGLISFLLLTFRLLDVPSITVLRDGHLVSRIADFIMYSVEAEFIDNVVAQYGPCKPLRLSLNVC